MQVVLIYSYTAELFLIFVGKRLMDEKTVLGYEEYYR